MARSIPGQRTRGPGRIGKQRKGGAQQSGRKRGAKLPTKERPTKENLPPSAPRTKGQLEQGAGSKGHARIGRRGKERPHPRERSESGFSVQLEGLRPRTRPRQLAPITSKLPGISGTSPRGPLEMRAFRGANQNPRQQNVQRSGPRPW